jgi:hypothetical protein
MSANTVIHSITSINTSKAKTESEHEQMKNKEAGEQKRLLISSYH